MKKHSILALALLGGIALSSAGGPQAAAEEKYKVGFLGSLSGFLGPFDDPVLKGMQVAIDELNKSGGIAGKYPVELTVIDSKSDPAQAQIAGGELIDGGAKFLIGPCSGDIAIPPAQLAQEAGIPFVSSCSADSAFVSKVGDAAFLVNPGALAEGAALADYAVKTRGFKTAYVVTSKDLVFTQQTSDGFAYTFEKLGGKVVQTDYVKLWQPSQAAVVTKIKSMDPKPDVIMSSLFVPDMPGFVKELRSAGIETPVLLNEGNDTKLFLAPGVQLGDVTVASIGIATPGSALEKFYGLYQAKFGQAPESNFVGTGGDIVAVMSAAVAAAGSIEPAAVKDALSNLADFDAVTAKLTYKGAGGIPKRNVFLIAPNQDQSGFELRATVAPDIVMGQ